jgi:hypothetical protein
MPQKSQSPDTNKRRQTCENLKLSVLELSEGESRQIDFVMHSVIVGTGPNPATRAICGLEVVSSRFMVQNVKQNWQERIW